MKRNYFGNEIEKMLGLDAEDILKGTFIESAYLIALTDKETNIEACFKPRTIVIENKLTHPLSRKERDGQEMHRLNL